MRNGDLKKPAKCVLPYRKGDEHHDTYELMPLPDSTFHQFAELPDKIKSRIWREFYLEPRYYIAELHPKDDKIEGKDYNWVLESCDETTPGEEPCEEETAEEDASKKMTPVGNSSKRSTPQSDALHTNALKGQPYDEYLSDEYSSEEESSEDEAAENGEAEDGTAENGTVENGAIRDRAIDNPFDELEFDQVDDELDNVEGRGSTNSLIRPSSNGSNPFDKENEETEKATHRTVFWTLSRQDAEYSDGYYDSVDTNIDSLSRSVAQSVRSPFWFSAFVKDEPEEGEEGPWIAIPPPKDLASKMGGNVTINWDIDFVHVKVRFRTCVTESIGWMQNIQNIVVDTKPFVARRPQHVTNTCFWMWTNKATLSNLKTIRQIAAPECQVPFWHSEWCHYQMRHLLRFAPGTPPQWRDIQSELVSDEFWLPPDNLPRQPEWKQFVRDFFGKLRHAIGSRTFKNYMRVPHRSDKDEAKGARVLFDVVKRHPSHFHGVLFHSPDKCGHKFTAAEIV
ncbi:hypothetical protein HER10_EVM0011241 [Colletotrichum scovillei]|uniref:uncharacterized protein n=1 Tax=Colletotrichum scovillei TaxID=1209932 RepID=UPI0015C3806D|nr:uncharacterized protein HER10_EVM0011241 [Colletotrichum scovillei]KAF4780359.1 hypothetical protein HER10_EVM0011241 [Colletotrichum scovillei]